MGLSTSFSIVKIKEIVHVSQERKNMRAPFYFEFETESPDSSIYSIRSGYFWVDFDPENEAELEKLTVFLENKVHEKIRPSFDDKFGSHVEIIEDGALLSWASHEVEPQNFKHLMRQWRKAFEREGFSASDPVICEKEEFVKAVEQMDDLSKKWAVYIANGQVDPEQAPKKKMGM